MAWIQVQTCYSSDGFHATHDSRSSSRHPAAPTASHATHDSRSSSRHPAVPTASHATHDSRSSSRHPTAPSASHATHDTASNSRQPRETPDHVAEAPINAHRYQLQAVDGQVYLPDSAKVHIRNAIQSRADPNGSSWKKLSPAKVDFYWREFAKFYQWDPSDITLVYKAWETKIKERYRDLMCSIRHGKVVGRWVPLEIMNKWVEDWASDESKQRSEVNKVNRRGKQSIDQALPTHTAGARSFEETQKMLVGHWERDVSLGEVHSYTHTKKNDQQTWIFEKKMLRNRAFQITQEGWFQEDESARPTPNDMFVDAVGGFDKKGRIPGIGFLVKKVRRPNRASRVTQPIPTPPMTNDVLQQLLQKLEEVASTQQTMKEEWEQWRKNYGPGPQDDDDGPRGHTTCLAAS